MLSKAFVQAKLGTDVSMKTFVRFAGRGPEKVVKLDRALYGIKQAGRQWSAVLCQASGDEHDVEQCRADPCVYRKIPEDG